MHKVSHNEWGTVTRTIPRYIWQEDGETMSQPQYELEDDPDFEGDPDLKCGIGCPHFDGFNQCCWLSWQNHEEGDYCSYDLKIGVNGMIVYPDISRNTHAKRTVKP